MNGKQYNAVTGELIAAESATSTGNIDGFARSKSTHVNLAPPRIQPVAVPIVTKPVMDMAPRHRKARTAAKNATKTIQPSQTLMRHAVAKPGAPLKRTVKAHSNTSALVAKPTVAPKQMAKVVDERRSKVAQNTPKSSRISKFSRRTATDSAPLPVTVHIRKASPQRFTPKPAKKDIFTEALEQATSHEQTYEAPRKKGRNIATVAAALVVVAGLGLGGTHGLKAAKVHMASSKAGFSITSPTYTPAGFSLRNLSSEAGSASLNFVSNSDKRNFSITEKASQWDSSSLKNSVLDATGKKYQTVEAAGRTIFIDDDYNANWVNGGIWYQVSNENALNNRQIINIAQSL